MLLRAGCMGLWADGRADPATRATHCAAPVPHCRAVVQVEKFGQGTPMSRAGQPSEVAPAYVFLASEDASYISGQTLHPNGGRVVNA